MLGEKRINAVFFHQEFAYLSCAFGVIELGLNDKEINNYKKSMKRRIIFTEKAPLPVGPYNQAIMIGKVLYISGPVSYTHLRAHET